MSFITKRERVFNDYELFDLPSRNEGKLKAYGSCTDTRAWSHFTSDKAENLVEIIKRNNERCATKYVPTKVIVETLMVTKNAEIARLKRKVGLFEQMIAVYDQLDLTNDQKNEIEKAHDAIKAASCDLDNMFLDLNVSGYTEGIDSEAFETGKSRADESHNMIRGDEWSFEDKESKTVQTDRMMGDTTEKSTHAIDPRINEMQEVIICKDAKLNAMRNTIAVLENDVCQPFCVYAQIYTAIEKIIAILYQHDKYKEYLDLLMSGTEVKGDIEGKICFKMMVLEKFCLALVAPCSRGLYRPPQDCACYHAGVVTRIETTYALTDADTFPAAPTDVKRTQLVADIMEQTDMKDILSKSSQDDDGLETCDNIEICLESVNLRRLKQLQSNYADLVQCYDNVKHERICLQLRCARYNELEYELEGLRVQMSEYHTLWNEKEHYKKRSECMDELKEKYLLLYEESANLDTQLKAEYERNDMKSRTIADLRNDNIELEKKLNEATILFEKGQNTVECKLKEAECKCMCYEEQVKSLSSQIDRLLEQEQEQPEKENQNCIYLLNEIEMLKEQSKNLKDLLLSSDEEKKSLQEQFRDNLNNINELKMEIEHWKSALEKCRCQNDYLENYIESVKDENRILTQDLEEKSIAVENFLGVIKKKKLEINNLTSKIEKIQEKNNDLVKQLNETQFDYTSSINALEGEARSSLELSKKESASKIKENEELLNKLNDMKQILQIQTSKATVTDEENRQLREEIRRMSGINEEKCHLITTLDKEKRQSEIFQGELYQKLSLEYQNFKQSFEKKINDKELLENEVCRLRDELQNINLSLKNNNKDLQDTIDSLTIDNNTLKSDKGEKENAINDIENRLLQIQNENINLKTRIEQIPYLEAKLEDLKNTLNNLLYEKLLLKNELDVATNALNDLRDTVSNKFKENESLVDEIKLLKLHRTESQHSMDSIVKKNVSIEEELDSLKEENERVQRSTMEILKDYKNLQLALDEMQRNLNESSAEKELLLREIEAIKSDLKNSEEKNNELHRKSTELFLHNETLETTLINTRKEVFNSQPPKDLCEDLYIEIQEIKKENLNNRNNIRELRDTLEEQENTNCFLIEDLKERDHKIAIQQNHINELEFELRQLHDSLNKAVDVSEEFQENAHQKIDLSLRKMEAHHSKATHNMKMEMAVLQSHKASLEEQLSTTKLQTEQTNKDQSNQTSELQQLKNERKIIATEIKELELMSAGDTNLSPLNCDIEDLLTSIDKIRTHLHKTTTESSNLEKRFSKVQSSSQLLLCKAEEAKKLIEKEKQKILDEKEEAINDRKCLENKLNELKLTLEKEKLNDKKVIKDLENEILNQQLIIDKINESSQSYESKLKEEINNLKSSYDDRIAELQLKLDEMCEKDKHKNQDLAENKKLIEKVNNALRDKSNELSILQSQLEKIKSKSYKSNKTQTSFETIFKENIENKEVQTEIKDQMESELSEVNEENRRHIDHSFPNMLKVKPGIEKKLNNLKSQQKPISENDVQILTAQIKQNQVFENNLNIKPKNPDVQRPTSSPNKLNNQKKSNKNQENDTIFSQEKENKLKSLKNTNSYEVLQEKYNTAKSNYVQNGEKTSENSFATHVLDEDYKKNKFQKAKHITDTLYTTKIHEDAKAKPGLQNQKSISDDSYATPIDADRKIGPNKTPQKANSSRQTFSKSIKFSENQSSVDNIDHKDNISLDGSQNSTDKDLIYIIKSDSSINIVTKKSINDKPVSKSSNKDKSQTKSLNEDKVKIKSIKDKFTKPSHKGFSSITQKSSNFKSNSSIKNKVSNNDSPQAQNYKNNSSKIINDLKPTEGSLSLSSIVDNKTINVIKIDSNSTFKSTSEPNIAAASVKQQNSAISDKKYFKINSGAKIDKEKIKSSDKKNIVHQTKVKAEAKGILDLNENLKTKALESKKQRNYNDLHRSSKGITDNLSKKKNIKNATDAIPDQIPHHSTIKENESNKNIDAKLDDKMDLGMKYILDTIKNEIGPSYKNKSSENLFYQEDTRSLTKHPIKTTTTSSTVSTQHTQTDEKNAMTKDESVTDYENRIEYLTQALENSKRDSKRVIEEIKHQYDNNIRSMKNEHEHGVLNMQGLHEVTLHEILSGHENEVDILRSMSIEAMKKLDKLEKEKQILMKSNSGNNLLPDSTYPRERRLHEKTLTKSIVQALDVTPKVIRHGPCTCTVGANLSDMVRKMFEKVDGAKRKLAEQAYLNFICKKFLSNNIDSLDTQELSFLHFKVCRAWKHKHEMEEILQKRIDSLENEVMTKQRNAYEYIAELDRQVAKEKCRLQEVREAVCFNPDAEYAAGISSSTNQKPNTNEIAHLDRLHLEGGCDYDNGLVKLLSEKEEMSVSEKSNSASTGHRVQHCISIEEELSPLTGGVRETIVLRPNAASSSMFEITSNINIGLTKYECSRDTMVEGCNCVESKHRTPDRAAAAATGSYSHGRRAKLMKTEKDKFQFQSSRRQQATSNQIGHELIGEIPTTRRPKRPKSGNEKPFVVSYMETSPERRGFTDELPTRLRRVHDSAMTRGARASKK